MGEPPTPEQIPVKVIRSSRRRKSVAAVMRAGVLQLTVPSWLSDAEEARWVDTMRQRFARQRQAAAVDLDGRARRLATRYGLPAPGEIRWVTNMAQRWGSCTPASGTIRLSDRMAEFPEWVLDYVVVHELAHLVEPNHSTAFHELERRYPLAERAIGFLIARSGGDGIDHPD